MNTEHTPISKPEDIDRRSRVVDGHNRAVMGDTDSLENRDIGYGIVDSIGGLATANSGEFEPSGRIEDPDLDAEWREQVAADRARRNLHAVPATTRRSTARQQNLNELDYIKRVRTGI